MLIDSLIAMLKATIPLLEKKRKWRPSSASELGRLSVRARDDDWTIAGTNVVASLPRTRGKKLVLSPLLTSPVTAKLCVWSSSSEDEEEDNNNDEDEQEQEELEEEKAQFEAPATNVAEDDGAIVEPENKNTKPPHSRVLLEIGPLVELIESNLETCPKCGSKMRVETKVGGYTGLPLTILCMDPLQHTTITHHGKNRHFAHFID